MLHKFRKYIYPVNLIVDLIPSNSKILDLGCGQGDLLKILKNKKKIKFYKGIDPKLKNEFKNKYSELSRLYIEDVIGEISNFECILLIDVMHHIKKNDQNLLIEKIISQLNNGAIFIYKDISNKNYFFANMNKLHDLIYNNEFINYYKVDKLIHFIKNSNNLSYERFYNRIFWYDHEFLIIKKDYSK